MWVRVGGWVCGRGAGVRAWVGTEAGVSAGKVERWAVEKSHADDRGGGQDQCATHVIKK